MAQQHWPLNHWPSSHWPLTHWPQAAPFGHWNANHWPVGHWNASHWPSDSVSVYNHWPSGHWQLSHWPLSHWPSFGGVENVLSAETPSLELSASGQSAARITFDIEFVATFTETAVLPFFQASADASLQQFTAVAAGTALGPVSGSLLASIPPLEASAAGSWRYDLSGVAVMPSPDAFGAGFAQDPSAGTLAADIPALTATGAGSSVNDSTLDASLGALEITATGATRAPVDGSLDAFTPNLEASGGGGIGTSRTGTVDAFTPSFTASAVASLAFPSVSGTVDATAPEFLAFAFGTAFEPAFTGPLVGVLPSLEATSDGSVSFTGPLFGQLPEFSVDALGDFSPGEREGTIVAELPQLYASGSDQSAQATRTIKLIARRRVLILRSRNRLETFPIHEG